MTINNVDDFIFMEEEKCLFYGQLTSYGLNARKPVFGVCKQQRRRPACASAQTDQHLCFRFLESSISKLYTGEISIFQLVSVAEETGLNLTLSESPKTGFVATRPIYDYQTD